jgi:antitoxin component YwqK of YwqJK toxin-antitoxin module
MEEYIVSDGFWIEYYENGNKAKEYFNTAGELNGEYKEYYTNGSLKLKGYYYQGAPKGIFYYYNENGSENKRDTTFKHW